MIDFIGIGAQKCGTSWLYACLYEHPEIYAPIKEIHFFSRDRFSKGITWYEDHFKACTISKKRGEFSTSYLYSDVAAKRITELYPNVRLIAIVREPIARAYSQYGNALKAGEIGKDTTFAMYVATEPSCIAQGLYVEQLEHYRHFLEKGLLKVMIYEDIARDPKRFVAEVYEHLGVDSTFVPPSLTSRINIARQPRLVIFDRVMHRTAEFLRRAGLHRVVHTIKTSGLTDWIRHHNTEAGKEEQMIDYQTYIPYFRDDVVKLGKLLNRDLVKEWQL